MGKYIKIILPVTLIFLIITIYVQKSDNNPKVELKKV